MRSPSVLRREGVPATFFLTGNFVRDFPATARPIAAAGSRIGNHTVSHPHLTRLSDAAVLQEILGGARQVTAVVGKNPAPLFLFPFGGESARAIAIADQAGYVPVRWTVDRTTCRLTTPRTRHCPRPGGRLRDPGQHREHSRRAAYRRLT
jgi:peptidoglycan/xylan/chitin deacetylase (PgdA/CDA1 family)